MTEQELCDLDPHQHESMFYGTEPYHLLESSDSDGSSKHNSIDNNFEAKP